MLITCPVLEHDNQAHYYPHYPNLWGVIIYGAYINIAGGTNWIIKQYIQDTSSRMER